MAHLHLSATTFHKMAAAWLAMAATVIPTLTGSSASAATAGGESSITSMAENFGSRNQDARHAHPNWLRLAQATAPQPASDSSAVGSVASVTGGPTVTRGDKQLNLAAGNEVFKGDVLQTGNNAALGVTFDDETTLTLGANTQISINDYVYQKANTRNAAVLNVARGTLAFIAGQVAKTGDMKIATPTAALGIRGTTGVVDVPVDQSGAPGETKIKLYQDQGGTVGRIEIFDNSGARLGLLSRASTGFAVRLDQALSRSLGQPRFAAVAFAIAPQELARDRNQVRQLFSVHTLGRQIINLRRGGGIVPPGGLQRLPNLQNAPGIRPLQGQGRLPALQRQPNLPQTPNLQRGTNLQRAVKPLRLPGQTAKPVKQKLPGVPGLQTPNIPVQIR